jgi:hypothetical protein
MSTRYSQAGPRGCPVSRSDDEPMKAKETVEADWALYLPGAAAAAIPALPTSECVGSG